MVRLVVSAAVVGHVWLFEKIFSWLQDEGDTESFGDISIGTRRGLCGADRHFAARLRTRFDIEGIPLNSSTAKGAVD
jgi:hypothetical protein